MEVNIKKSKGTKKAENKVKVDVIENRIINKIDKYKLRKLERKTRKWELYMKRKIQGLKK